MEECLPPQFSLGLAHVLPPEVERASNWIDGWLRRTGTDARVFYLVQPSTFIKLDEKYKTAWYRGVISIAVVTRVGIAMAFIRPTEKHSAQVVALLEAQKVPVYSDDLNSEERVAKFLGEHLSRDLSVKNIKEVQNRTEVWLYRLLNLTLGLDTSRLEERLGGDALELALLKLRREEAMAKFRVYHEVCLTEVITLSQDTAQRFPKLRDEYIGIENRRCDLLLASSPPDSKPLLVLEFDGRPHLNPIQIAKDESRDQLINLAGLPVIRVSILSVGVDSVTEDVPSLAERRKLAEKTEPFIEFFIEALVNHIYAEQIEVPKRQAPKIEWSIDEFRRRVRAAEKRQSKILTSAEKVRILEEVALDAQDKFQNLDDDRWEELERLVEYYQRNSDIDDMVRSLKIPARFDEIRVEHDPVAGSVCASCILILQNGKKERLVTDTFYVKAKTKGTILDGVPYLQDVLKDGARMVLFGMGMKRLEQLKSN